ncbi:GtrA family protein [Enterobacter cloacae complex sp. P24RS]|uniref:GtrA family protein n=1 Tax=Enterobacter cloacae complex sp. P24RS TaxID=2779568 RepID=UPI00187696F5|nr:GtrA family protein [Enterobacter cloacae complex sp. P24RS]
MRASLFIFMRYISVGVANTIIHVLVFLLTCFLFSFPQSLANVTAFFFAASFSFVVNAVWTFKKKRALHKYLLFMAVMSCLAWSTGKVSEIVDLPAVFTLCLFSFISMVLGFVFSRCVIFKD